MSNDGALVTSNDLVASGGSTQAAAMDGATARSLTDKIKIGLEMTWQLVTNAYEGRVWVALGYASWDEYCIREFGTSRLRLPREERDEIVASLASSGMSERAIASATGLGNGTVHRALVPGPPVSGAPFGAADSAAQPPSVIALDGRAYAAEKPTRADVLKRQTAAALLAQSGKTQVEIAGELGVSQPTVSADLKQMGQLIDTKGLVVDAATVDSLTTGGRIDTDKLAAHFGVTTRPTRDLGRLARGVCADLTAPAAVLVEKVVLADEWLDVDQRRAACATIVPALTRVVRDFQRAAKDIHRPDVDSATWHEWTAALTELGHVAHRIAEERAA